MLRNIQTGVPWKPATYGGTQTNRTQLKEGKQKSKMYDSDRDKYAAGTQIQRQKGLQIPRYIKF